MGKAEKAVDSYTDNLVDKIYRQIDKLQTEQNETRQNALTMNPYSPAYMVLVVKDIEYTARIEAYRDVLLNLM